MFRNLPRTLVPAVLFVPFVLYAGWAIFHGANEMASRTARRDAPGNFEAPSAPQVKVAVEDLRAAHAGLIQFNPPAARPNPTPRLRPLLEAVKNRADLLDDMTTLQTAETESKLSFRSPANAHAFFVELDQKRTTADQQKKDVQKWFSSRQPARDAAEAQTALADLRARLSRYRENPLHDYPFAAGRELEALALVARDLIKVAHVAYLQELRRGPGAMDPVGEGGARSGQVLELLTEYRDRSSRLHSEGSIAPAPSEEMATELARWEARRELLLRLADNPASVPADGVGRYLAEIGDLTSRIRNDEVDELVRQRIQQACSHLLPLKLALDENVLYADEACRRVDVSVIFEGSGKEGGKDPELPLSADPEKFNEFTLRRNGPPGSPVPLRKGPGRGFIEHLKPTRASEAAALYSERRREVKVWSAAEVGKLAEACRAYGELLNTRPELLADGKPGTGPARTWDRLAQLEQAIKDCPKLFRQRPGRD